MKIYPSEKSIANLITNKTAYAAPILIDDFPNDIEIPSSDFIKSIGTNINQKDLFYLKSVLVTTGKNRNDDVFLSDEVWKARTTPEDKPFNLNHSEAEIIGHITDNYVVDALYNKIDDNTAIENLPNKFHILTLAVLYKHWESETLKIRTKQLVEDIASGKKYVSMEVLFNNFDYAVGNYNESDYKIVTRGENTAYLSKYLKIYKGTGVYNNKPIARVLRNLVFCGKGLVDTPANPESYILDINCKAVSFKTPNTQKVFIMDPEKLVENYREDLKTAKAELVASEKVKVELVIANENLKKEKVEVSNELTQANKKIELIDTELTSTKASLTVANDEIKKLKSDKDESDKKYDEMSKECASVKAENTTLKAEKAEAELKIRDNIRASKLITDFGKTSDEASALVKSFAKLSDDEFSGLLALLPKSVAKTVAEDTNPLETQTTSQAAPVITSDDVENLDSFKSIAAEVQSLFEDSEIVHKKS